jgi:lipid-binding SYLF domain-containing protein
MFWPFDPEAIEPKEKRMNRRDFVVLSANTLAASITAFTTTTSYASEAESKRREINAAADGALKKLYASVHGSRELAGKANGILVFPSVIAAGLVVGGEYGKGVLRVDGKSVGYYSTATGSFGLQAGGQSKSVILMFMAQHELDKFRNSKGWTAGVDGSVALAKIGANGNIDTNTIHAPIIGFVMTNAGLMATLSLEGTKISRLNI